MFHSNYFVSLSLKSSRGGEDSWVLIISKAPCKGTQHCWMLHLTSVCTPCCTLCRVVGSCCAKFETGQTYEPTNPNISFVPWSPKRSATMLKSCGSYLSEDELQVRQHCSSCCIHLHTTANTDTTTPNIVGPTIGWELMRPIARGL